MDSLYIAIYRFYNDGMARRFVSNPPGVRGGSKMQFTRTVDTKSRSFKKIIKKYLKPKKIELIKVTPWLFNDFPKCQIEQQAFTNAAL